jgi:hypothetical protein
MHNRVKGWIRIRIKPVVEYSYHFNEKQDPDPDLDPHQSEAGSIPVMRICNPAFKKTYSTYIKKLI